MKILKILGVVAAVHVVAVVLLFAIQGCSSTSKSAASAAPAVADNADATVRFNAPSDNATVTPTAVADPADAPSGVSFNGPTLYSPTRPGTPAATVLASSSPVTNVTPAATYTVVKGDSFRKIAAKYHMTSAELAKANNLKLSSPIILGQKLIIPAKASSTPSYAEAASSGVTTYKVKSGDSLTLIAKRNGISLSTLRSLNRLKTDTVRIGQELKIPTGVGQATVASAPVDATPAPAVTEPEPVRNTGGGTTYTVKSGEKLSTIAKRYGVTVGELATANNISDPGKIRAGQQLVIPAAGAKSGTAAESPAASAGTPSSINQDLDAGLKPSTEAPVIKVEDNGTTPAANDTSNKTSDSDQPQNP